LYNPIAVKGKKTSLITLCLYCGGIYISTDFMKCPFCIKSGNIKIIPIYESKKPENQLTFKWLHEHGMPYIEEMVKK